MNKTFREKERNKFRYRKQINGCKIGRVLGDWVKKVKTLRNTNWHL